VRDVRDWNKYVEMVGKTVSKRTVPIRPDPPTHRTLEQVQAAATPAPAVQPTRKGRGPRKEETREELLSRLLDPTLTLEETARILEVCPTTVRRYTNKGILPHERSQGNQRRFKLSSVIKFRESQLRADGDASE
jgi:excisionase family DNA binding protein